MRFIHLSLFCLLISLNPYLVFAQNNSKARIDLEYFKVNEDGRLLGFKSGVIYRTDSFGGDWESTRPSIKQDKYLSHRFIEAYGLFNVDTFLISGFLHDTVPSQGGLLRTIDGGFSFQKIDLPHGTPLSALFVNDKGEAWVTTYTGIYFTSDYGAYWQQIGKEARSEVKAANKIYFKDSLNGIFSGGQWGLFVTHDNCKTFKSLQTPYDQKKRMPDTFNDSRNIDIIYDVLLYNDWLIVQSGNQWFYTQSDSIHWLPLAIKDVYLDRKTNQLWGFNRANQVVQLNEKLNISWTNTQPLPFDYPLSMQVVKGDLYLIGEQYVYKINTEATIRTLNHVKNTSIEIDEEHRDTSYSLVWGWDYYDLYQSKDLGKTWGRVAVLPTAFQHPRSAYGLDIDEYGSRTFTAINDSVISLYAHNTMQRVQFNAQTQAFTPHRMAGVFDDFLKSKIKKVTIEKITSGKPLYGPVIGVAYQLNKRQKYFKSAYGKRTDFYDYDDSKWQKFKNKIVYNHKRFKPAKIEAFMQYLNQQPEKSLSWADFKREQVDKKATFKQLLARKEAKEDKYSIFNRISEDDPLFYPIIDTAYLKTIVFEKDYPDSLITEIFKPHWLGVVRTYTQMTVENENGETIKIRKEAAYKTPANLIWEIEYKNWFFRTADINIFHFMYSLSPKTFWNFYNREAWETYLEIARYLHPRQLLKN